jgi:hypothetical protein
MEKDVQVKRRQKTESGGSVVYAVGLASEDGLVKLTVKSRDGALMQMFKKDAWISLMIGVDPQKTLDETAGGS